MKNTNDTLPRGDEFTRWHKKIPPLESIVLFNGTVVQNVHPTQSASLIVHTPISTSATEKELHDDKSK